MIGRHPHVFGDASVAREEALGAVGSDQSARGRRPRARRSVLDGVPRAAVAAAGARSRTRPRASFDWPDARGGVGSREENPLGAAQGTASAMPDASERSWASALSLVNVARLSALDAEEAACTARSRSSAALQPTWNEELVARGSRSPPWRPIARASSGSGQATNAAREAMRLPDRPDVPSRSERGDITDGRSTRSSTQRTPRWRWHRRRRRHQAQVASSFEEEAMRQGPVEVGEAG